MKGQLLCRLVVIFVSLTIACTVGAQQSKVSLPMVVAASVPLYPIGPHTTNIQGTVRIRVSTDGHRVVHASVETDGGNPALGKAAQ